MPDQRLPNLIIAGVNKAGTTSLFSYLSIHPDVCVSTVKETCYFLPVRYGRELPPVSEYMSYFNRCQAQKYLLESTPGYFYGGATVAQTVREQLGDVKIIIILREPVQRLLSFFKAQKSMLNLDQHLSLSEYIHRCERMQPEEKHKQENNAYFGIEGGLYVEYLPAWFNTFGESVKVLWFDTLQENAPMLLRDLSEWLNIDHTVFSAGNFHVENRSANYKNKYLHRAARFINVKGEAFWRTHPHFKRFLRHSYYFVNEKPFHATDAEESIAYLKSIFEPYNQKLVVELLQRGYSTFPEWLTHHVAKKRQRETDAIL